MTGRDTRPYSPRRRDLSVVTRALLAAMIPVLAASVLLTLYFTSVRIGDLEQAIEERGVTLARHLAPASEYGVFSGNAEVLQPLVAAVMRERGVNGIEIRDAGGGLLAKGGTLARDSAATGRAAGEVTISPGREESLLFSAPIRRTQTALEELYEASPREQPRPAETAALGTVTVEFSLAPVAERKRALLHQSLLIAALGLALAVVLAQQLSRELTRPIRRLAGAMTGLRSGALDTRVAEESTGELRELERGLNAMAEALQDAQTGLEQRIADATAELAERKRQADEANLAKSRFLAAASHDLRQPVHALSLFVARLQSQAEEPATRAALPELPRLAGQIGASASALQRLLDGLLDISRLDSGTLEPSLRALPLAPLLKRVAEQFAPVAQARGLDMRVRSTPVWVMSDPVLLERILLNLVSNAIRYTERGGVLIACRTRGRTAHIGVWDTGPGIAAEHREAIFREFYQLPVPGRGGGGGLGLGLSIVEGLCRLLDLRLRLESVLGRGSVFVVEARSTPGEQPAPGKQAPEHPPTALAGARVMIVDDDTLIREGTAATLRDWGMEPLTAASPSEALRLAQGTAPMDVVLCDFRLDGDKDGLEVIAALRELWGSGLPAVLITADTDPALEDRSRLSNCMLLRKPLAPSRLRALLNQLTKRRGAP